MTKKKIVVFFSALAMTLTLPLVAPSDALALKGGRGGSAPDDRPYEEPSNLPVVPKVNYQKNYNNAKTAASAAAVRVETKQTELQNINTQIEQTTAEISAEEQELAKLKEKSEVKREPAAKDPKKASEALDVILSKEEKPPYVSELIEEAVDDQLNELDQASDEKLKEVSEALGVDPKHAGRAKKVGLKLMKRGTKIVGAVGAIGDVAQDYAYDLKEQEQEDARKKFADNATEAEKTMLEAVDRMGSAADKKQESQKMSEEIEQLKEKQAKLDREAAKEMAEAKQLKEEAERQLEQEIDAKEKSIADSKTQKQELLQQKGSKEQELANAKKDSQAKEKALTDAQTALVKSQQGGGSGGGEEGYLSRNDGSDPSKVSSPKKVDVADPYVGPADSTLPTYLPPNVSPTPVFQ